MKKQKFEFELWWLWVPVLVATSLRLVNHPIAFLLFVLALLNVGLYPRKPRVIYAYLNSMLGIVKWAMSVYSIVIAGAIAWIATKKIMVSDELLFASSLISIGIFGIYLAYAAYWSLPYSRKRSGIAAVDAAIARYRKPGEKIEGQWIPDMIIDGKRYRAVIYLTGGLNAPLGFELDGGVVRDETLTNTIVQCLKFALNIMYPERINWRTDAYKDLQKAIRLGKKALQQWSRLFGGFPSEHAVEIERLRRGLEMWLEFAEGLCRYWYLEAEYGMRHGNVKMKEVRYEDVERLNAEVDVYRREQERYINGEWEPVFRAARRLANLLYEQPKLRTGERKALIDLMLEFQYADVFEEARYFGKEKKLVPYLPMTAREMHAWRSRLEWVDLVDSWVAQGYEGKALEAKKREYLAEQARLEAERKRQEEAEKARQREEQAQKRAVRKAQRKPKERKESEG